MQTASALNQPMIRHDYAQLKDVRLHYAECGPENDELVILLHGFPECWYSWRYQLPLLGQRYHAVAPDMRGFNLSDKPLGKRNYIVDLLVKDVLNLIRYFDKEKAAIVSHDWGAVVGWALASRNPEVVTRLVAMQVPPPACWRANFTLKQLMASWYMFFFQLPKIPESWARANDFARIDKMYRVTTFRPGAFSTEDIAVYKEALRQPGALTSTVNYYRANVFKSLFRRRVEGQDQRAIKVPTLFIYGEHDMAVLPSTVHNLQRFIDAPYRELRIPDSGHWVQNEAVDEVNQALVEFLGEETI